MVFLWPSPSGLLDRGWISFSGWHPPAGGWLVCVPYWAARTYWARVGILPLYPYLPPKPGRAARLLLGSQAAPRTAADVSFHQRVGAAPGIFIHRARAGTHFVCTRQFPL